jgi:HAD superfamily hydrolase (TIGR01509 family)
MTPPTQLRGALFDLDGVLIDSARAWYATIVAGSTHRGDLTFDEFVGTFGQGPEADRRDYFPSWTRAQVDAFYLDTFPRHLDQVALMPDALWLLGQLRAERLQLAVVTNTPRPLAEAVLSHKGLTPLIDSLSAAGDAAEKPAPDLIELALARLGLSADEVIYVGDSASDRQAARAAGTYMVGLDTEGDSTIDRLAELPAQLAIRSS